MEELKGLRDECLQLYQDERIFAAAKQWREIKTKLEGFGEEDKTAFVNSFADTVEWLEKDETCLNYLLNSITGKNDDAAHQWKLARETDGVQTWFKYEDGEPTLDIKLNGIANANVLDCVSVITEVDLFKNWMPTIGSFGLVSSKELLRVKKAKRIARLHFGLPWPMSSRVVQAEGFGADCLEEEGCMMLVIRSVDEYPGVDFPVDKHVHINVHIGGFRLTPTSETETKIEWFFNIDPRLSYVPYSLVNYTLKSFAHLGFDMFRKMAETVEGSEYETRRANEKELYGLLQRRCNEHFGWQLTRYC